MQTLSRRLIGAAVLAALASLAAVTVALGQESEEVTINDKLSPKRLEVTTGTVVTWRNDGDGHGHALSDRSGPRDPVAVACHCWNASVTRPV